jgi:hypothetical protein
MSRRRTHLIDLEENPQATHLKIEVYYNLGGWNYFTGVKEGRGIYLSVSPVTRTVLKGGGTSESYKGFSGIKQLVKPMARFNQNVFNYFSYDEDTYNTLVNHVLSRNNLKLKEEKK